MLLRVKHSLLSLSAWPFPIEKKSVPDVCALICLNVTSLYLSKRSTMLWIASLFWTSLLSAVFQLFLFHFFDHLVQQSIEYWESLQITIWYLLKKSLSSQINKAVWIACSSALLLVSDLSVYISQLALCGSFSPKNIPIPALAWAAPLLKHPPSVKMNFYSFYPLSLFIVIWSTFKHSFSSSSCCYNF